MKATLGWVHKRRKALAAAVIAGASVYLADRSGGMTGDEWWQVVGAALVAGGIVHQVPNRA